MDMITLAAARKYVNDTANALGAVKGSPCTIKSITETDDGATVVFSWTGADGVEQTSSTFLPRGPQGLPGEKGEPGVPGKDGSGTVDTVAREQITALTDEMLTTEAKAELAALCPEIFADPDVKILYDPDRTEIAHSEFRDNLDIEVAYFPNVTKINPFAFYGCTNLLAVVFPKLIKLQAGNAFDYCTSLKYLGLPEVTHFSNGCFQHCSSLEAFSHKAISVDAFGECTNLTTITLPEAITVGGFVNCTSLTEINLPVASYFNNNAFMGCTSLTKVCLPDEKNSTIYFNDEIFMNCSNLTALILPSEKVAQYRTVRTGLFTNTPIAEGTGYIYVPASLIESYKNAEPSRYGVSWADYAAQFRAIEDYPEICDPTMDEPLTKAEAAALIDSKLEVKVPNGATAHQMLVTDEEGKQKWENRTHYKAKSANVLLDDVFQWGSQSKQVSSDFSYIAGHVYRVYYAVGQQSADNALSAELEIIGEFTAYRSSNRVYIIGLENTEIASWSNSGDSNVWFAITKDGVSTTTYKRIIVEEIAEEVVQIAEEYIPSTIARTDNVNTLIDSKLEGAGGGSGEWDMIIDFDGDDKLRGDTPFSSLVFTKGTYEEILAKAKSGEKPRVLLRCSYQEGSDTWYTYYEPFRVVDNHPYVSMSFMQMPTGENAFIMIQMSATDNMIVALT